MSHQCPGAYLGYMLDRRALSPAKPKVVLHLVKDLRTMSNPQANKRSTCPPSESTEERGRASLKIDRALAAPAIDRQTQAYEPTNQPTGVESRVESCTPPRPRINAHLHPHTATAAHTYPHPHPVRLDCSGQLPVQISAYGLHRIVPECGRPGSDDVSSASSRVRQHKAIRVKRALVR